MNKNMWEEIVPISSKVLDSRLKPDISEIEFWRIKAVFCDIP
jgi:hypothetical protein